RERCRAWSAPGASAPTARLTDGPGAGSCAPPAVAGLGPRWPRRTYEKKEAAMPTVRLRDVEEYPESTRKLFEVAKAWFKYDFAQPPAMSRVMAWDPELGGFHGRAMKRAMAPGEL